MFQSANEIEKATKRSTRLRITIFTILLFLKVRIQQTFGINIHKGWF